MPNPRFRIRVALLATTLALGGCSSVASTPAQPASSSGSSAPSPTETAAPSGTSGLPEGGIAVPGLGSEQQTNNDPNLPISISVPLVPAQPALNEAVAAFARAQEADFRAAYAPRAEAPPELNVSWRLVQATGSLAVVRVAVREFAGASGQTTLRVFYGDGSASWPAGDLIEPAAVPAFVAAVRRGAAASGVATFDASDPSADTAVVNDLVISADGSITVALGQGVLAPYAAGTFSVVVPPADAATMLSARGRAVLDTVRQGRPYAASGADQVPATTASVAAPTPAVPAPAPGAVDCSAAKCVALTFDDGPAGHTSRLLDTLESTGTPATFFVLGQQVRTHPGLITRMVRLGMTVANHTWDHRDMRRLSLAEARDEVQQTEAALRALGVPPSGLLRPPYGALNADTRTLGMALVLWDVDTLDWQNRNAQTTTDKALAQVRSGSIILMHDIHPSSVDAVPGLIRALRERGYTLVTVPQLLGATTAGAVYSRRG